MTPSSLILGLAERMIRLACRRLPEDARDERYREWTAELPAILHDPDTRPALRRALRVLIFAADQHRGIRLPRAIVSRIANILTSFVATFFAMVALGGGNVAKLIVFLALAGISLAGWWAKVSGRRDDKAEPR